LAEDENLLAFGQQRLEKFEQGLGLAGSAIVTDELRVAADLAQAGKRCKDVNLAFVETFLRNGLQDLLAAAPEFGEIKFALGFAKFAIAAFLDTVRQIFRDLLFEAAKHEGAKLGGEPATSDALSNIGVLFDFGFVSLREVVLAAEIPRLDEVGDAPKVE
jgi:hypothetical protein